MYEAEELFELLDLDKDGSITVDEFVEGSPTAESTPTYGVRLRTDVRLVRRSSSSLSSLLTG